MPLVRQFTLLLEREREPHAMNVQVFLSIMKTNVTHLNVPLGFSVSNVTNGSDHTKADPHKQIVDGKDTSMIQHNADKAQQRRE